LVMPRIKRDLPTARPHPTLEKWHLSFKFASIRIALALRRIP
jgi:hypothetical protein